MAGRGQPDAQAEIGGNRCSELDHDHQRADRDGSAHGVDRSRQPPAPARTARSHQSMSTSGPRPPGPQRRQFTTIPPLLPSPPDNNPSSPRDRWHQAANPKAATPSSDLTHLLLDQWPLHDLGKPSRNFPGKSRTLRSRACGGATICLPWGKGTGAERVCPAARSSRPSGGPPRYSAPCSGRCSRSLSGCRPAVPRGPPARASRP